MKNVFENIWIKALDKTVFKDKG